MPPLSQSAKTPAAAGAAAMSDSVKGMLPVLIDMDLLPWPGGNATPMRRAVEGGASVAIARRSGMEQPREPGLDVALALALQVHAAVAHVLQHVLDHAASVLGREPVEGPRKGVREMPLV